ncbi:hypothetical protein [Alteromonas halophila]|uniref:hypothetical protein n=1 Tax=Alteromonas halophila TaxID=516698 RepID=UPI001676A72F|nr:hypothetical protein [Alteromonas halophila]
MNYLKLLLLSMCISLSYYALTVTAIGIAAAGNIFWWYQPTEHFHFYHVAQNFVGIGIAALIPAYLVHCYEFQKRWISISVVILGSMLIQGNINYMPLDPAGLLRFFKQTLVYGDLGSVGIFLEIVVLPLLWLLGKMRISLSPLRLTARCLVKAVFCRPNGLSQKRPEQVLGCKPRRAGPEARIRCVSFLTKGDCHCLRNLPCDYALQDSLSDDRLIRIFPST